MPQKRVGRRAWRRSAEFNVALDVEIPRVDPKRYLPRNPKSPPKSRSGRSSGRAPESQVKAAPRAEILPAALSQQEAIYYYPDGHNQDTGPPDLSGPPAMPTIRVNHNHNHVTRHDDRERNLFLFMVTGLMLGVGGLAGAALAVGFGWPRWPAAGVGGAAVALPALAYVLRVASRDPAREQHGTERRRDRLQATLQRARDRMEHQRENRRIDIEARTAKEQAALAREKEATERSQALALAEQAKADRARILAQAQRHAQPQSSSNQLYNYVEPHPGPPLGREGIGAVRLPNDPPVDEVRSQMLAALTALYDPDAKRVEASGLIANGYKLPWSKRGGLTEAQRNRALDMLHQLEVVGAPLFVYREEQRRWALNVKRYPTLEEAIEALDRTRTRKMTG